MEDLTNNSQKAIFSASGGRSNAKGGYRLLANKKFTLDKMQQGVTEETIAAMAGESVVLLIQDTTDANYNTHKKTVGLGYSSENVLGVKIHTCWLDTMRETTALIPKNITAITLCDRECDFYEFYGVSGTVEVNIPRDNRRNIKARTAEMEISFAQVTLPKPLIRKEEHLVDSVTMNVVRIVEKNPPANCEPIKWFLATNLPINSAEDAFKIVQYYVQRWKIERFHYVLKNGCSIEKIQQRTYNGIVKMILIYSTIAAYILAMTLTAQNSTEAMCDSFF